MGDKVERGKDGGRVSGRWSRRKTRFLMTNDHQHHEHWYIYSNQQIIITAVHKKI